jgi:hypothetical protein
VSSISDHLAYTRVPVRLGYHVLPGHAIPADAYFSNAWLTGKGERSVLDVDHERTRLVNGDVADRVRIRPKTANLALGVARHFPLDHGYDRGAAPAMEP